MQYSIANHRDVSQEEIELLNRVFEEQHPEWLPNIANLKVIMRCCGCGKCPTAFFDDESTTKIDVSSYITNDKLTCKGITLYGNNNVPSGIEFW